MLMLPYLLVFCILCVVVDYLVAQEQRRIEIPVEERFDDEWLDRLVG